MKLLALYGFLFVLLLCLSAFTAEGTVCSSNTTVSFLFLCFFFLVTFKKDSLFSNCMLILIKENKQSLTPGKDRINLGKNLELRNVHQCFVRFVAFPLLLFVAHHTA